MKKELEYSDVWNDLEKQRELSQKAADLEELIFQTREIEKELKDLKDFSEILGKKPDPELEEEIEKKKNDLQEKIRNLKTKVFLSGPYDKNNAVLTIRAGTGGQDAQDWASMIMRMYQRYCEKKGFQTKVLSYSYGDPGPEGRILTKEAILEVKGKYAYGLLKKEQGAHRLVRLSPFSAQNLRHTSFVSVEVIPVIRKSERKIELKPEDLKIETFRASGPGGQYVNRRETAVRITHLPTGIVVACQSERSQSMNKEKAIEILLSKLYQLREKEEKEKIDKLRDKRIRASWGHQIRSYIFHPYKLVKDYRTKVETSDIEKVLDGEIDNFIEAEIMLLNKESGN
ncbi:peptide chain release factor 2 [bacterium]|nr:peptide chain release factor 2 [bacterium]